MVEGSEHGPGREGEEGEACDITFHKKFKTLWKKKKNTVRKL